MDTPYQIGPVGRDDAGRIIERLRTITPHWARPLVVAYLVDEDSALLVVVNTAVHMAVEHALYELRARPCPPIRGEIAGTRGRLAGDTFTAWLAGDTWEEEEREYGL